MEKLLNIDTGDWAVQLAGFAAAVGVALLAHWVFFAIAGRAVPRFGLSLAERVLSHVKRPAALFLPTLAALAYLPAVDLAPPVVEAASRGLTLILIGSIGWMILRGVTACFNYAAERYRIDHADNLEARQMRTRLDVFRRIAFFVIVVVTAAIMMMTIPAIRALGVSLFASAGVAGLVIGLAARPAISNLIAGIQIALAQPIRVDDVVIVEGEWGRIEEITTTFVVVKIWDERRLVVPLSHFIEKPFQNWTRQTADLLGTVFLYVDYTVPVDEIRAELDRVVRDHELWDGKVCLVQVTNTTERTVELRALISASNSGNAWDLRCHVREKLVGFVQANYPEALPRLRAELDRSGPQESGPDGEKEAA